MAAVTLNAYAKINLFLDITGRRPDGYHTISGIMQSVSLCDTVTVTLSPVAEGESPRHTLSCSDPRIPTDGRNLGLKAAEAFFAATGTGNTHLHIHIDKCIPAAAGMAGGSTDAAAVLKGLNRLTGEILSVEALCRMGLSLGADVPFCLMGGTQVAEGVGELLTPCAPLPDCYLVVACAGEGVSTPAAYGKLDAFYGNFDGSAYAPKADALAAQMNALSQGDLCGAGKYAYNIFESAVLPTHSRAGYIKEQLLAAHALFAMMSGSGPSVFGVFDSEASAHAAMDVLHQASIPAWVCRPIGG